MSEIELVDHSEVGVRMVRWRLGGADTGSPINLSAFPDKTYNMYGVTWGSATIVLQGSWDLLDYPPKEATWLTLNESDNATAISNTSNTAGVVLENPVWIRPKSSGGTGTAVDVVLICTK